MALSRLKIEICKLMYISSKFSFFPKFMLEAGYSYGPCKQLIEHYKIKSFFTAF
jgi:hypothetical protein